MPSRLRSSTVAKRSGNSKSTRSTPTHSRVTRSTAASSKRATSSKRPRYEVIVEVVIEQAAKRIRKDVAASSSHREKVVDLPPKKGRLSTIVKHLIGRLNVRSLSLELEPLTVKNAIYMNDKSTYMDEEPRLNREEIWEITQAQWNNRERRYKTKAAQKKADERYWNARHEREREEEAKVEEVKAKLMKYKDKRERSLARCFPSSTLETLICTRTNESQLQGAEEIDVDNTALWHCTTSCSKLKRLEWWSREAQGRIHSDEKFDRIDYSLKGTPLAECRLDQFTFDAPYEPKIDDAFLLVISQVKRLDINTRFSASQLRKIFRLIKDCVEELTYTNYNPPYFIRKSRLNTENTEDEEEDDEEEGEEEVLEMPKLRKLHAAFCLVGTEFDRYQLPSPCSIRAPTVTSLNFARFESIDWVLLESCRSTLESFTVGTGGEDLPERLQDELFDMPELVEFALDMTNDHNSDYRYGDKFFFTKFWDAIDKGDTERSDISIRDVLPKLKSLILIDDIRVSYARLVGMLDLRKRLGLTSIEWLTLWFNHDSALSEDEIEMLKSRIPNVTFRHKEEYWDPFFCDMKANRAFAWH